MKLYYLICSRCREQLDFVEAGVDLDGFLVIEVDPCKCEVNYAGNKEDKSSTCNN